MGSSIGSSRHAAMTFRLPAQPFNEGRWPGGSESTPETDRVVKENGLYDDDEIVVLARKLERERNEAQKELAAANRRVAYLQKHIFARQWNGVLGEGSRYTWGMAGPYRHVLQKFVGDTLNEAIDEAMKNG